MCLGIPGRVVELVEGYAGHLALVDVEGASRQVNVGMLDGPPPVGAWVLVHMGFAVEVVDRAQAEAARSGLELMGRGAPERVRRQYEVTGLVQGVGFRPFVSVTAAQLGLTGWVTNDADGVRVEVEGDDQAVGELGRRLAEDAPPLAVVESVTATDLGPRGGTGFVIEESRTGERARTLAAPDVATCPDCRAELADPADRRHRHPFITCTSCGPRFTITTALPYDRATTTMAGFAMCERCATEYADPADRRYHAQPIACPDCGPTLELVDRDGRRLHARDEAVAAARSLLGEGRVVAVKGLGGYHLACDARNEDAVAELRRRKRRGDKPFAVMAADLDVARRAAETDPASEALLAGPRHPVVLLPRRLRDPALPDFVPPEVADSVAPGNPDLGVMLPYTPVHLLLLGLEGDPPGPDLLVMTSGNLAGEPIVTDDADALSRLGDLADAWLRHDRPVHVPCDDSVARFVAGAELPVRRSRGYAPLPVALPFEIEPTLAVGADLKNTCALGEGRYAFLSAHVGDMDDVATIAALTRTVTQLEGLTGVSPTRLVADAHPSYRSHQWALEHAAGRDSAVEVDTVQHHHAHVASVMGEHGLGADEEVVGIAFDGTGYGTDGAIWGGEALVADYKSFQRLAHLGYVPLAGGDASVERPYRMALAHLWAAGIGWNDDLPSVRACPEDERRVLAHQLETGFGATPTSSMGRLFDAVASLVGERHVVDYEAEAAIGLEGLARQCADGEVDGGYRFALRTEETPYVADPGPVIGSVVADVRAGVPAEVVAARFHAAVTTLVVDLARAAREHSGLDVVALGGGVFQNALLLAGTQRALADADFRVLRPRLLPPNDGGIALGQLLVAACR